MIRRLGILAVLLAVSFAALAEERAPTATEKSIAKARDYANRGEEENSKPRSERREADANANGPQISAEENARAEKGMDNTLNLLDRMMQKF